MAQNIAKIEFAPGIQKDQSPLASEPGWVDSQWIRFRGNKPESMGGYTAFPGNADLQAAALASHQWTDLDGNKWLAFGTASGIKVVDSAGTVTDITPTRKGRGSFDSVQVKQISGSTTYTVTVLNYGSYSFSAGDDEFDETNIGHGLDDGDSVYLSWINATKTITVIDPITFTYEAGAAGSSVTTEYIGQYYECAFPSNFTGWSLDNFGENLVAVPTGGALYQWQPSTTFISDEKVVDGNFDSAANWEAGAGWTVNVGSPGYVEFSGDASTAVLTLFQTLDGYMVAGEIYQLQFEAATASTDVFLLFTHVDSLAAFTADEDPKVLAYIAPVASGATTYKTYTLTVRAPSAVDPNITSFNRLAVWVTSPGGAVSVTIRLRNISIAKTGGILETIPEAPAKSNAMFVDPNRFVVLLGTIDAANTYNPLLVRWCDQENLSEWSPRADNLAGELPLSTGVNLVNGVVTRGQNVLLTESDAHSMQFTGDPGTVFVINPIASNCGLIAKRAIAKDNTGGVYWWSNAGQFFRFTGGSVEPIPSMILRDIVENTAQSYLTKIHTGLNPAFNEIFWFYPDSRDSATNVTRYAKLCYTTGVWDVGSFVCTAWLPQGIYNYPIAVDGDGDIFLMENGNDANGSALTTSITSSYFDIEDGGNLTIIQRIIPDFDDQQGDVSFDFNLKMYPNGPVITKGPYSSRPWTQKIDTIFTARQVQGIISSSADPSFWRMGALRFDIRKSGSQR